VALLKPDTARIGHPPGNQQKIAFPKSRLWTPRELREALSELIGPTRFCIEQIDLVATHPMPAPIALSASRRHSAHRR